MKKRLKNWITTFIGISMMIIGVGMIVNNYFFAADIAVFEIIMVLLFGWVFLFAKDTLLEGVFLNLFRVRRKD